jgi:TolA-binding protein
MTRTAAAEDLLVGARRNELDEDEERRLELSLNASRELSLLYEAGIGFDAEACLLPGDEARTAQLVQRALNEHARQVLPTVSPTRGALAVPSAARPRAGARYFALSVACGALLSVAVASAWQAAQQRWFAPIAARQAPSPARPPATATAVARPSSGAPVAAEVAALPSEPPVSPQGAGAVSKPPGVPSSKPSFSPRELFTRASAARRSGDIEAAIGMYEELCAKYPSSVEAEDARLVLGNLRLEQRSPRAALSQFENYGSGALSLEAMWGKAQALRKLESPEERTVLEALVRDYPSSPYAAAAKKRLQELAR